MAAKVVSQHKFAKLVSSTSPLAQPPGALTRLSNLLFTTRGSLQIAAGSLAIANGIKLVAPGPLPAYALSISAFSKSNPTLGIGQYPPVLTFLQQLATPSLAGVTGASVIANAGGSNPNPAGDYWFAIVAIDTSGGVTSTGFAGASVLLITGSAFNTVTLNWTNLAGNQGYQVWFLGFQAIPFPGAYAGRRGYLLGTVAANTTTFTTSAALLPNPNVQAPWLNTTQYLSLIDLYYEIGFGYVLASPGSTLLPANYNIFPAAAPQPAPLPIGDPQFVPTAIIPNYSPYGGILGQACPIPTQVQFAGQIIAILGNGLPPVAYDPSTGIPPSSPAPLANTFTAAYPDWQASVDWITGAQVTDGAGNFYTATQGESPRPPARQLGTYPWRPNPADGSVIWTSQGPIVASTPPRGAAHAVAYAGSLWLANTSPTDTSDGIDGPTCLKMSDSNNPNSWNPVNTAFIGRNDGTQITGPSRSQSPRLGISPTGSLCVFKEFTTYQVIGVFGSTSFEIQPAQTNLGCIAARSIQFIPGFGVVRFSHLGFAVFDGINDRLISEDIRPYLFGGADSEADSSPLTRASLIGRSLHRRSRRRCTCARCRWPRIPLAQPAPARSLAYSATTL